MLEFKVKFKNFRNFRPSWDLTLKPTSRSTPIDKVLSYKINYTIICSELYLELYRVHVNLSFLIYTCLGRFLSFVFKKVVELDQLFLAYTNGIWNLRKSIDRNLSKWSEKWIYCSTHKNDFWVFGFFKLRIFSKSTVYQYICPILSDKNSLLGYDDRPRLHSNV